MASNDIRRGAAEMSVAMLMSGTIGWLVVSSQQSAFNVVFFRCIFGGATLALVCAALGLSRRKLFSWKMVGLALLGGAAIVANWVLLFAAYSRASISMATAVYNTQPFMLVALGAIVFRERISASTVLWLVLAFIGLVFVVKVEPAVLAVPGQYLVGIGYAVGKDNGCKEAIWQALGKGAVAGNDDQTGGAPGANLAQPVGLLLRIVAR